ncbi:uncharacterized protein PV09_04545 [Verruconis gallopava]|uniref:Uncharacterized protein n=1 Tax=Verruconis gallopava TaxID=253628 RepID=A0A0D2AYJ1_9PEZI|nr:uncharacterized protein PV09_04545 [Verruconis gallopava]KIW04239.1 hypothetical protein PV09_04545 [Verruconis gallopava]
MTSLRKSAGSGQRRLGGYRQLFHCDQAFLLFTPYQAGHPATADDLPALGQLIEPPRRATPTLPPGLFPNLESQFIELPRRGHPSANERETVQGDFISRPSSGAPRDKAVADAKSKIQHIRPATPVRPAAKDPTPAESVGSKKEKSGVATKSETPKKNTTQSPNKTEVLASDAKGKSTPSKTAGSAKADETAPISAHERKAIAEQKMEAITSKRPHPGKLNIETSTVSAKEKDVDSPMPSASSKPDIVGRLSRAPSVSATSLGSRPGTPQLGSTVATGSPLKRTVQPRTIRITDTPKVETTPVLAPATTTTTATAAVSTPPSVAAAQTVPSKVVSRRTSIASLNAPGTPFTERTDTMSVTSTSASRANSPPPVLTKAKSKKKEKAKKEKALQVEALIASKEGPAEEVAPIMARKTKSKKSKAAREGPTPVTKPTPPPAIAEEKTESTPVAKSSPQATTSVEATKTETDEKGKAENHENSTKHKSPPSSQDSNAHDQKTTESSSPLTAAAILQALESTRQLALSTLNMLKPLSSQSELKRLGIDPFTSADLQNHIEQLRFELTKADEQLLKQGQAVRKDLSEHISKNGRLSGRCLVTPAGTRLSCLTKEEEDRYLELEKRVIAEKGISRWGGAGVSHITKQSLKPKKSKLQSTLAQEDILRALSIATESLEGALRDATKGSNPMARAESLSGPSPVHLAGQTAASAARADVHPQDPSLDAREYVNKFVPRVLDLNPSTVAVPPGEDDVEDQYVPSTAGWSNGRFPVHHSDQALEVTPQHLADATAAAGLASRSDYNLRSPSPHVSVPSSASVTEANTAAAMDTLKEAMATAGLIAKLGANEELKSSEAQKSKEKATGAAAGNHKNLHTTLEKAGRREGGGTKAAGAAMSMADLERESLRERIAEAKRDAADWEKRFNKLVRANRKLVLGNH